MPGSCEPAKVCSRHPGRNIFHCWKVNGLDPIIRFKMRPTYWYDVHEKSSRIRCYGHAVHGGLGDGDEVIVLRLYFDAVYYLLGYII